MHRIVCATLCNKVTEVKEHLHSPVRTLGFIIGHLSKNLWQIQVDKVTLGAFVMKTEGLCWNTDSKLDLVLFFTHFLHCKHFKLDQLCQQPRPTGSRLFGLKFNL